MLNVIAYLKTNGMLQVGDHVPELSATIQNGEPVNTVNWIGKKLILFFYPRDLTPGCTEEACDLRDNYAYWLAKGYTIYGISADDEKSHTKFISKHNFPFDLIADTDLQFCKAFGVWGLKKFMGREFEGIKRTTFVVNESGVISHIFEKVKTKMHSAQLESVL